MSRLQELRNKIAKKRTESSQGNFFADNNVYPFWKMEDDESCKVRFLPDANTDNEMMFWVEKFTHNLNVNGKFRQVLCPKTFDFEADCPICKLSAEFYAAKDDQNGKRYWRKKHYLFNALIIDDPIVSKDGYENCTGKIKTIQLSNTNNDVFKIIENALTDTEELEDLPFDLERGYDFTIKKTKDGKYSSYGIGTRFARKPTDISDEVDEDDLIDLSTLIGKEMDIEKIEALLDADINGDEVNVDDDDDDDDDEKKVKPKSAKKLSKDDDDDDDDEDEEGDDEDDDDDETESKKSKSKSSKSKPSKAAPKKSSKDDDDDDDDNDDDDDDDDEEMQRLKDELKKFQSRKGK